MAGILLPVVFHLGSCEPSCKLRLKDSPRSGGAEHFSCWWIACEVAQQQLTTVHPHAVVNIRRTRSV